MPKAVTKKIVATALAALALGTLALPESALAQTAAKRSNQAHPAKPPMPLLNLPAKSNGEKAIANLGANLPAVAAHYGKTADALRAQLRSDRSAWIDKNGKLFFIEQGLTASPSDVAQSGAVYPADQTFLLHSRKSSKRKIYLDFNGHTTTGTAWNTSYGITSIVSPAFDLDGLPGTFSATELTVIQNIWRRVAEDYAAFDVDVTTEEPPVDQMTRTSSLDDTYGTRAVITKNFTAGTVQGDCGCGGFAYVGVFDATSEANKPAFIFQDKLGNGEKAIAEATSHEVGHNLGLSHDGTSTVGYYAGHGSGATGWAPIMGVGYNKELVQFSKGEYLNANNTEDDYLVMQNNGVTFAADDFGNTIATAATLSPTAVSGMNTYDILGVIETPSDVDMFSFNSGAGTVTINAKPFQLSPNLDILIQLRDAAGNLVAEANPADALNGSIAVNLAAAGTYFLSIEGSGLGDPLGTGYSAYGSIGRYSVSLSAPLTVGGAPVAVISASPTSGPAPLNVSFSGAASSDAAGIVSYEWNFGDGTPLAAGMTASHVYNVGGSYTASLKVTNSAGFSGSSTVAISATTVQPKIYASAIAMSLVSPNRMQGYAQAKVTVKDAAGNVIPNATVAGSWSGLVSGAKTGLTNASGVATIDSAASKKTGTFKFTITGITAAGYTYDAGLNVMSSNSISR
ncbi:PKD domain-containing protein [Pseudoduganella sp. LjRoot289]|uniref:PKD domain-containing protein n=1 Tax=Pseudoduganella sp. LjRoot289 TaxID=3342314 RepID=UPI003ECECAE4